MERQSEYEYAKLLYLKGFLQGPDTCNDRCKNFDLQAFSNNKTHGCCFRCMNNKCRKHHLIVTNSFFQNFHIILLKLFQR